MVDSISSTGPVSTLLRAQQSTLAAVNSSQQATQTLINHLSNGARPTTVQPGTKAVGPNEDLPRGSLVDILA